MSPDSPLFLVFFFSIFHALGGAAVGRAIRTLQSEPQNSLTLFIWGGIMGLGPLVFDWFFLIREGELGYGMIGPAVFVVVALVGGFLWRGALEKIDGGAIASAAVGGAACLIGIMLAPYLIGIARTRQLEIADWCFGTLLVLLFVGVGASFAWTGALAIFHGHTFDEEIKLRQKAIDARSSKSKQGKQ
ncbi:MAG: hypothetical protein HY868_08680 [Chloroflexi bacterium]|nr:hypothetical protein [Chloroflexota bacterium]